MQTPRKPSQLKHLNQGGKDGAGEVLRKATQLTSMRWLLCWFHALAKEGNHEEANQKTHHDIYKFCPLRGGRSRWCKFHLEIEERKCGATKADGWVGRKMPLPTENKLVEEAADDRGAVNWIMVLGVCAHVPTSGYPTTTRDQPEKHLGWLLQH